MRIALIVLALALAGCTSRTEFGECIGVADERNPTLIYKLSAWNAGLAILFVELIIPPVIVLANETFCPVAKRWTDK